MLEVRVISNLTIVKVVTAMINIFGVLFYITFHAVSRHLGTPCSLSHQTTQQKRYQTRNSPSSAVSRFQYDKSSPTSQK